MVVKMNEGLSITRLWMPETYYSLATGVGQKAVGLAGAFLQRPHISKRLEAEMPENRARIGAQYVTIAGRLKRQAETEEDLKTGSAMLGAGHLLITGAVLEADTKDEVPVQVTRRTVNYALAQDTNPQLLVPPGLVSEFEARRAVEVIGRYTPAHW